MKFHGWIISVQKIVSELSLVHQLSILVFNEKLPEAPEAMPGKPAVEFDTYPTISNYSPLRHHFQSKLPLSFRTVS